MRRTSRSLAVLAVFLAAASILAAGCSTPRSASASSSTAQASGEPVDWNVRPPPKHVTGHPMRVKYVDFFRGNTFQLVNESHTNALDLYSKKVPKTQAFTKVQTDEVVQALLDRLEDQGATKRLQPGLAPSYPLGTRAGALEIEGEKGPSFWLILDKTSIDERAAFNKSAKDFVDLYNATESWQAVQGTPEWIDAANESARRQAPRTLDTRKLEGSGKKP
jgi:hypothetical protein